MTKWKSNNYKFWHSPIALLLILCFFGFFSYNVFGLIEKQRETSEKKEIILGEISELKDKEADLTYKMSRLETEEGVEEIIRDKYQVAKQGEKMIIIVDDDRKKINEEDKKVSHNFFSWFVNMFR